MIASRSGIARLPRVIWRRTARRSVKALTSFLAASGYGDPVARRKQIEEAVESLRYSPLRCTVAGIKDGLTFRRLTVDDRFYVYYVFIPSRRTSSGGTLSIRAVKHAASQNPFLEVREPGAHERPLDVPSTHDRTDLFIA